MYHASARAFAATLMLIAGTAFSAQQPAPDAPPVSGAQPESEQPAAVPEQTNQAVVVAVGGSVRVQAKADAPFEAVTVGRLLPVGARVKTGLNSSVTLRIGAGQLFVIESIANVTIQTAFRKATAADQRGADGQPETDRTVLGVDYGRVLFNIDSSVVANDVSIEAPDSTLDVDGTEGFIEVAGRQTRAGGAKTNTGSFTVRYDGGQEATINDDSETDADTPDPADKATQQTRSETGGSEARTDTENDATTRSPGGAQPLRGPIGLPTGPTPPPDPNEELEDSVGDVVDLPDLPAPGSGGGSPGDGEDPGDGGGFEPVDGGAFFLLDADLRDLVRGDIEAPGFGPMPVLEGVPGLLTPAGGLAARQIGDGLLEVFHINSDRDFGEDGIPEGTPVNSLYRTVFNVDGSGAVPQFELIAQFRDTAQDTLVAGLASLGGDLYASGIELNTLNSELIDPYLVLRLDPSEETFERVASFGLVLQGGLASTDRGTLIVAGERADLNAPTGEFLGDVVFIEFDPRNRLIVNAFDGSQGGLGPAAGAEIDPLFDLEDAIDDETGPEVPENLGLAFLNDQIVVAINDVGFGDTDVAGLLVFDASPGLSPTTPRLLEATTIGDGFPIGLTGIASGGIAPPPLPLSNPGPGGIDRRTIDPLFAGLAYNEVALGSGVIQTLFEDAFLRTAQDRVGCASSSLFAMIPGTLQSRVNQESGIGRASFDLRDGLDSEHPCFSTAGPPSVEPAN